MRVLLIADVHANWEALLSLQRAEQKPDAVLFAGDAVGYGPDPANCARWLLANTTAAVRGNHDDAVYRNEGEGMCFGVPTELAPAAREMIAYSRQFLSAHDLNGIGSWPLSTSVALGGAHFYLVHGSPADPLCGQVNPATCSEAELHALFDGITADVIALGHTHMPALRSFDGRLIINPGSLGQPRYGTPDATYAVWEDGQIQIKHLHYDHDATVNRLRLASFSPEVTEQLAGILETGLLIY
ncbi:MAG TPA: YfcE family phosphodiesterase [Anaerolineales bacterium]|nr:YfcE family phosphodiesterase [Anaerolineales bacterium]